MAIYLNNAATTWPKPPEVAEAVTAFLVEGGANLARGSASKRDLGTLDLVTTCREELASFFGGYEKGDPRYVTFTGNVTEALNLVLKGFCKPGMTVLTTSMEHNAVIRPLRRLQEERGLEVNVLPCDDGGFLRLEELEHRLGEGADLMVLSHASNVCGAVQDLQEVASLCSRNGIPLVLDAAQTGGEVPLSASSLNLAALCFTGHKSLLGPPGIGGVVWRPDFAREVLPLLDGGTGSFSAEERQPLVLPDKFEAGTPNLPGVAGLLAALRVVRSGAMVARSARKKELGEMLRRELACLPGCRVVGGGADPKRRLAVVALNVDGWDNGTLAFELAERWGVETRPGLHCAPLAHRTLGTFPGGALRLSPGVFTEEAELRVCLEALVTLAKERC